MRDTPITWPGNEPERRGPEHSAASRLFRLRLKDREILLPRGEFVVGRSRSCDLVVDDMLVSRRHARFFVSRNSLFVEDLSSANGVLVNEATTSGVVALQEGDRVIIGTCELIVICAETAPRPPASSSRRGPPPTSLTEKDIPVITSAPQLEVAPREVPGSFDESLEDTQRTEKMDGLATMARLADRMISMGRADAAVRLLSDHLRDLLEKTQQGRSVPPPTLELAGVYSLKLADIAKDGAWATLGVEIFTAAKKPLPAKAVQLLETMGTGLPNFDRQKLTFYKAALREAHGLSAAEVALAERILKLPVR
ncbi:MAG: FHA domain-containing protein [Polyangiaceae bacterium]